jgi:pimeloyl-ACP methyl ester carboxylesterase
MLKVVPDELKNPEIQTSMINVDSGLTFEVDHCGDGDELALCLHGFPEHSFSWRYQLPMLAKRGFTAWAPNLRGYGNTSRPRAIKDYALNELVEDVAQLIVASKKKKVTLIGHDWGGFIAWDFAIVDRLSLERLIIFNCPHPRSFIEAFGWSQLRKSWYMFFFQIPWLPEFLSRLKNASAIGTIFEKTNKNNAAFPPEIIDIYRRNASQPLALRAMINYYRAARYGAWARERRWRNNPHERINTKTLVIWGEEDNFLEKSLATNTGQYVADLQLRFLPGASHWVQQERPDEVNQLILEFLSGYEPPLEAGTKGMTLS